MMIPSTSTQASKFDESNQTKKEPNSGEVTPNSSRYYFIFDLFLIDFYLRNSRTFESNSSSAGSHVPKTENYNYFNLILLPHGRKRLCKLVI